MTTSLSLALLGSQVAHRLPGVSTPSVSLLVVLAIAAWTMTGPISRGVVILAVAIFDLRTRR